MKNTLLLLLLLPALNAPAQNLVKNPSFEAYDECPFSFSEVYPPTSASPGVADWYRATAGSSDYYNACSSSVGVVNVPNAFVYQEAKDGAAFMGEYSPTWYTDYHEYIEGNLISPLVAGHRIYTSFWIVMAWGSTESLAAGTENIGAYFSNDYIYEPTLPGLDFIPQVISPVGHVFVDTMNWEQISGIFTAAGGEEWITLGNFAPDDLGDPYGGNYHFVDNVCVLDLDGTAATMELHDTITCTGSPITLSGQDTADIFIWDDNSTMKDRIIDEPGTYWVKSVNYTSCSMHMDSFRVAKKTTPLPINLGNDTLICDNMPITLSVNDANFETFIWNTGQHAASITVTQPGEYAVTATSECYTGTDTIVLRNPPTPAVTLPADMLLCNGTPVTLGSYQPDVSFSWSTGATGCCIEVTQAGSYAVTISNMCNDTASDAITIAYSGCENCLLAPSAFSPNGDGLNDNFTILVNCMMRNYKLHIFNRWGQLVFTSSKPGEGWDGTVNGKPADVGTYFYDVEAKPMIGEIGEVNKKGDIILIR